MNATIRNETRATIQLLGVRVNALSIDQLISEIQECIKQERKVYLAYVNVHAINIAYALSWFRDFLNQSHITFCDGFGIKLGAILTRQYLPYRFTPPDFMESICELAYRRGWRLFFLGAKPGVSQAVADDFQSRLPGLQIKTHHGYFDKRHKSRENQQIVNEINQFQPQILVLGFGMPLQEKWIMENIESLNIKVAFPAGALFDYLSGQLPRAPHWMTDNGFEWLGRLVIEPGRLWRRYLIGNPLFFWRIFIHHYFGYILPK
jgi:N-acetylglucosaminyldiphosphoundecaprenol N-acetyl-beta-D-mannosaminyltransferase